MKKVAICDNCGATDDMNIGMACKDTLLKALPNIAKKLKEAA
jgi:hypothetical protein